MKTQRGKIALTFKCRIQINEFLGVQTCMFWFLAFLASYLIDSQSKANAVAHWAAAWIIQCCSVSAPVVRCMGKNQWRERLGAEPALFSTPVAKRASYVRRWETHRIRRMTSPGALSSCVPHPGTHSLMPSGPSSPSMDRYFKGTIVWVSICVIVLTQIVQIVTLALYENQVMLQLPWQPALKVCLLLKACFKVNVFSPGSGTSISWQSRAQQ